VAAALSVLAVTLSMMTDNPLACTFVLIPVFMLMGVADEAWNAVPMRGDALPQNDPGLPLH